MSEIQLQWKYHPELLNGLPLLTASCSLPSGHFYSVDVVIMRLSWWKAYREAIEKLIKHVIRHEGFSALFVLNSILQLDPTVLKAFVDSAMEL